MQIRKATKSDFEDVYSIECEAFGKDKEAELVKDLLNDPSAEPLLSLLAFENDKAVGHILFTRARLEPEASLSMSLLAPLAIIPEMQGKGVGGKLIRHGLKVLAESGVDIVFVLGHPGYYPRHGFIPVGERGFSAPYPIPQKYWDAWMFQELNPEKTEKYSGKVIVADKLNKPEHWRE
ncbi:GNAT family N-acetyltransferase [Candidatus Latescibacterota bacterium]